MQQPVEFLSQERLGLPPPQEGRIAGLTPPQQQTDERLGH